MTDLTYFSGEHYIWSLNTTALAAAKYPMYPATWQGLDAMQKRHEMAGGGVLDPKGPRDMPWALAAFADAQMRFNPTYEQVVA